MSVTKQMMNTIKSAPMKCFLSLAILMALLTQTAFLQAATLTASVDRNRITVNETLTLQLRYDAKTNANDLDLDALKQDFDVLGIRPQNSSSMSIINGQTTREELTIWSITLAPKREGALVIPSFNINGTVSNAIRIDVAKASAVVPQERPMIVRLSSDVNTAYPGQQILVKVELQAQNSVSNISGDQLRLDDAEVELLDQKSFRKIENGISWQMVEWTYAVFPEKAGTLAIPAQLFSGSLQTSQARNRFDPFRQQRGQRISARSTATSIEIEDMPETSGIPWFPANNVSIRSEWSGDTDQMRVGEPLTRMIQIVADGQRASVIPPLPENSSITYKTYKDQPQLENQPGANGMLGIRQESEAIVPSAEGILELPEQRISWWNTETGRWQETILPAETIEVLPALRNSSFAPPGGAPQFLPDQAAEVITVVEPTSIWWKVATSILGFICLLQFWFISTNRPVTRSERNTGSSSENSLKSAWKDVQKALKSGDSLAIRNTLLTWSQIAIPEQRIPSLQSLTSCLNYHGSEELRELLSKLDESLYKQESDLDINALSLALDQLRSNLSQKTEKQPGLAPLYPT